MADWLNPNADMLEGRDAGRQDRNREIEELLYVIKGLYEEYGELEAVNAELQAIVDKLPKCWQLVDGKLEQTCPVVPGMDVWWIRWGKSVRGYVYRVGLTGECIEVRLYDSPGSICASVRAPRNFHNTREAAEASR